ncbi:MAG TPA: TRAP transporter small permease subunit [Cyclobacteriaceae bacterium]
MKDRVIQVLDRITLSVGKLTSWLSFILVILITIDVVLRYVFNLSWAGLYELEWHLFAMIFLLGASYTLQEDKHVRVDLFYNNLPVRTKALINLIGYALFILPFCVVVFITSLPFVYDAYYIMEGSPDAGGLPARFVIKAFIPLAMLLLTLQSLSLILKSLKTIIDKP